MEGSSELTTRAAPPELTKRPVALITGASAGIGRVFAQRLAARGHDVILVARDAERLAALADELTLQYGVHTEVLAADLARDNGMRSVAELAARNDRLSVLVNNAGFGTKGKLVSRPVAEQASMLKLHTMAPMIVTRAALPGMVARAKGTIINVASVASFTFGAGAVNYCATKAYLRVFSQALALELVGSGVHVQALCPGFTHTEFQDRAAVRKSTIADYLWLDADFVVDQSLAQAEGRGATVCIPSLRYKLIVLGLRYLPSWVKSFGHAKYGKTRT
ncbi:MAG TPA: SDR family oxidoreductase [Gemmatimonadaceae bacterium]|nr:SDR family oxidoreductase [Gemmatimonadaceae bacterium]